MKYKIHQFVLFFLGLVPNQMSWRGLWALLMRTSLEAFQDTSQTVDEVMKIPWRTFLTIQILLTPINSTPKTGYDDGKEDMIHIDLGKIQQTSAEVTPNCGEKYGKSSPKCPKPFSFFLKKICPGCLMVCCFQWFFSPPSCWNREIIQSLSSTSRTSQHRSPHQWDDGLTF